MSFYRIKDYYHRIKLFFRSKYQKIRYGFEFRECWNLDYHCAEWIVPRLKHLRKITHSYPESLGSLENWQKALDEMIFGFEFVLKEDDYSSEAFPKDFNFGFRVVEGGIIWNDDRKPDYTEFDKLKERAEAGRMLFIKHFRALWD